MDATLQNWLIKGSAFGARFIPCEPGQVARGTAGGRLGRRPGESLEFVDFRDYQTGDDLRKLDWSAYARSDQLVVRVYREEITPHLDLVVDSSASMAVRPDKHRAAVTLAGWFAGAAASARYSSRCVQIDQTCREVAGGSSDPRSWQMGPFDGNDDSGKVFVTTPPRFHPRGLRIFVSDLLFPTDPQAVTAVLARQDATVAVVQLMDQADREPPEQGTLRLVDSETGEVHELYVDSNVRRRYQTRLEEHTQAWERACRRQGIRFARLAAEAVLEGDAEELIRRGVLQVR